MLKRIGYFGDVQVEVSVFPGDSQLCIERGVLPFVRHTSIQSDSWPLVIPSIPREKSKTGIRASASSNYHLRTEAIGTLVAELLNQLLRDLNFGADLVQLNQHVTALAAILPSRG
jgi:hypothetical protein